MKSIMLFFCTLLLTAAFTVGCGDGTAFDITKNFQGLEWNFTTPFTTARGTHTSIAYNNYLYVIGGHNGSGYVDNVQYAPINADGSIGSWTSTTSLTTARGSHTSVVHNGYLYVIGGYSSSCMSTVQYAPINADGTVGSWTATTSFTGARYCHTSVVQDGYLYVIGGYDCSSNRSDVQSALIGAGGTVGSWTATTSFTTAQQTHTSVVDNGHLYVIGGGSGSSFYSIVEFSNLNTSGGVVGLWSITTPFTTGRSRHTSVAYNNFLFVLGGYDGSTYLNDVQYATINTDGTVGAWEPTNSFTTGRHGHTSVVYNGYLYVIGGLTISTPHNDVQYARIHK